MYIEKNEEKFLEKACASLTFIYISAIYAFNELRIYIEIIYILILFSYFISNRKKLSAYFIWSVLFVGIVGLSNLWTFTSQSTLLATRGLLEIAIIGNLLIGYIDKEYKLLIIFKSFVFAGACLILRLIITTPFNSWGTERIGDAFYNANTIGLQLSISAICSLHIILLKKNVGKIYYILIPFFFMASVLTGSRKAFLFFGVGFFLIIVLNIKKKMYFLIMTPFIIFLGYILFSYLMTVPEFYQVLGRRIESLMNVLSGDGRVDNSTAIRINMIETGLRLWKERPTLGYGMNSYQSIAGFNKYAHNNYVELMVGVGLVGLVIYYLLYVYILHKNFKMMLQGNKNAIIFFTLVIVLLITEIGLESFGDETYQILLASGIAFLQIEFKRNRHINGMLIK